jgi:hypothetical protein
MLRLFAKQELGMTKLPYPNQIINDDGSLFEIAKPARQPINGLNTIAGDLDGVGATLRARQDDKKELDAKFAELQELIRQTRHDMEQKIVLTKKAEQ